MDPKQQQGARFQGVGTAALGTAIVTQGVATGHVAYITDLSGSSDIGTALLSVMDNGTVIWQNTISATVPYQYTFKQPIKSSGTVTVYISGASTSLKTVNVAGFLISS